MGLRIGAPLVQLHVYCHCGEQVDVKGTHGRDAVEARVVIQGMRSQGRYPRYEKPGLLSKVRLSECSSQEKFGL